MTYASETEGEDDLAIDRRHLPGHEGDSDEASHGDWSSGSDADGHDASDSTSDDEHEETAADLSDDADHGAKCGDTFSLTEDEEDEADARASARRRAAILLSSALLALLLLNFGYQLSRLRHEVGAAPPPRRSAGERARSDAGGERAERRHDDAHRRGDGENAARQRVQEREGDGDGDGGYRLPRRPGRIHTHASLSAKNYRAGGVFSDDMLRSYEEDGALVIRNLISPKLLARLDAAGGLLVARHREAGRERRGQQFHMAKHGALFLGVPRRRSCHSAEEEGSCDVVTEGRDGNETTLSQCGPSGEDLCNMDEESGDRNETTLSSFRELALHSKIPRVAASLLRLDEARAGGAQHLKPTRRDRPEPGEDQQSRGDDDVPLRVARDIFLTKDDDPYACGWHVDDAGFWPTVARDPGVNAWVALDDMPWPGPAPAATFALSLGSHRAPWRGRAYEATGSAHTDPPEGYESAADVITRRAGKGTCNIHTTAPDLHEELERNKVLYDLKRGDVIFHDRWLFHRTVTVREYGEMTRADPNQKTDRVFRRYSIRYAPGMSRVPPGYGTEPAVLHDPANANRTLDDIAQQSGPWYPRAWPRGAGADAAKEELEDLGRLAHVDLPQAEEWQKERRTEMQRLLSRRGKEY